MPWGMLTKADLTHGVLDVLLDTLPNRSKQLAVGLCGIAAEQSRDRVAFASVVVHL